MALDTFNIGKDGSFDLVHPTLGIIPLGLLTRLDVRPLTTRLMSAPITNAGKRVYRVLYDGWEGTFEVDRTNGIIDALIQLLEDSYFAGAPETYFLITQTIRNPDASIDEFRYKSTVIQPESGGTWAGEEKVSERFSFVSSQRERV